MSTWGEVKTEIKSLLNQSDDEVPAFYSDAQIEAWMRRGCVDLMQDTEINSRIVEYTFTADVTEIALSTISTTNILQLKEIGFWNVDDDEQCVRKLPRLNVLDFTRLTDEEDIYVCSIYNNTIHFNRTVITGSKLYIASRWDLVFPVDDDEVFPLPVGSEDAVIKYAVSMGAIKKGSADIFATFYALYGDRKKNLDELYKTLTYPTTPSGMSVNKDSNILYGRRINNAITGV